MSETVKTLIVSREQRGIEVAKFIRKRDALLHALKDMETEIVEKIIPLKVGDIVLYNRIDKKMNVAKYIGVVAGFHVLSAVTDVFVSVYLDSCPYDIEPFRNTEKKHKLLKVLFGDIIAVLVPKKDLPQKKVIRPERKPDDANV